MLKQVMETDEEMFRVIADVGDMPQCYPTLLIGWKHFIFDNIGPETV